MIVIKFKDWLRRSFTNDFDVLGINERNVSLIYTNNKRKYYKFADDKVLAKKKLDTHNIPNATTYAVVELMGDIQKTWKKIKHHQAMAIKPANGSGGGGIKILKKNALGAWMSSGKQISEKEIFLHMGSIIMGRYSLGSNDRVLIEECITPHRFFAEIYPAGVPDFRVILLKGKPIMSMLRVPTDRSDGKANLHQGGLGIGVDMEQGKLTHAYDGKAYYDVHPDNSKPIKGKDIPYWKEILEISIKVAECFPLHYIGVDIVIDKVQGPLIMEVNVRPGLGIQMANKNGMKKILKKVQGFME
ncbi:sugar-transfer associated ATP-grasp domain-containing protein [Tenacibaculum agarivorans]|uniref:sugar-transfer associated ATP-grasp domain-containing protein n=1 Tax=Tenacibaculum agarivorans TaxID=1908389 RepID=UPI000B12E950|nr:sugar-transfer associated ATP-grasp domain-containing protein [Tenacibaculum agarivorans]